MNSSTLANELIYIFGNASIGTAVKMVCTQKYVNEHAIWFNYVNIWSMLSQSITYRELS